MNKTATKKLAVMQPYFFPYLGYWQLIHAVDRFVIYDDVNFIKGGWINRNRILINGKPTYLTAPLRKASPNRRICDLSLMPSALWRDKLVRSVETTYRKAPFFWQTFPVIEGLARCNHTSLSEYLAHGITTLSRFMGITTELVLTSRGYGNDHLSGQERILDICRKDGAEVYVNPEGGQELYDAAVFANAGIRLCFLKMRARPYPQRSPGFVPNLSIIDALMELGPDEITRYLEEFDLLYPEGSPRPRK